MLEGLAGGHGCAATLLPGSAPLPPPGQTLTPLTGLQAAPRMHPSTHYPSQGILPLSVSYCFILHIQQNSSLMKPLIAPRHRTKDAYVIILVFHTCIAVYSEFFNPSETEQLKN